jgi:hypothetical protein
MEGTYLAAALGKLTSGLPTCSLSQRKIGFERRSTIGYLYVPEIAPRNSNHIPDGTRFPIESHSFHIPTLAVIRMVVDVVIPSAAVGLLMSWLGNASVGRNPLAL